MTELKWKPIFLKNEKRHKKVVFFKKAHQIFLGEFDIFLIQYWMVCFFVIYNLFPLLYLTQSLINFKEFKLHENWKSKSIFVNLIFLVKIIVKMFAAWKNMKISAKKKKRKCTTIQWDAFINTMIFLVWCLPHTRKLW